MRFYFSGFNQIEMGETNPREWHAIDEVAFASLHLVRVSCIEGMEPMATYLVAVRSDCCTWPKEVMDMT
jgi:hypothetical protein